MPYTIHWQQMSLSLPPTHGVFRVRGAEPPRTPRLRGHRPLDNPLEFVYQFLSLD